MVTKILDALPERKNIVKVHKNEELLLTFPKPDRRKTWREPPLPTAGFLQVLPLPATSSRAALCVWNGNRWILDRNMDVEEISLQVDGERTLMTELGNVDLRPGDWSKISVDVEAGQTTATAQRKANPFEGWTPSTGAIKLVTECLGARGCDLAVSLLDEAHLLTVGAESSNLLVVQPVCPIV
ncbi:hypothetical protein CRV24_008704 [Beauveria bassiana]|nr:hypothetical protein CRV24_008704 [Beauveria bassiana]KAH8715343.1 hypothetical protein HC256_004172 [Beauveria bassiana]